MSVPLITLFTKPNYEGRQYVITSWDGGDNDTVMIKILPDDFIVKSMKIDTRFNLQFFYDTWDVYINFLTRPAYTGNVSYSYYNDNDRYIRISLSHGRGFKTIIPIRDKTDPSTEYYSMTKIDSSKPTSNVELYSNYDFTGDRLVLLGQYDKLVQFVKHNWNYVIVVGVLPDNYQVKSIKTDDNVYVQLFETKNDYLLNIDTYMFNVDDSFFNSRPYYTYRRSLESYDFKYKTN